MKIIIPGGSGQVGTILARAFVTDGHEVVVLSRHPVQAPWKVLHWNPESQGPWIHELNGADVVINLAGRSVDCRYHKANRQAILDSRLSSTRTVGRAIADCSQPPSLWLQASTATIYAHRYDAPNDESTGFIGGNEPNAPDTWKFSVDVAKAWEESATEFRTPHTRLILMRSAMTMSPDAGGVFDVLRTLTHRGLGGTNGNGRQYVSWIHEVDFIRAVNWIMEHTNLDGPVNIASPNPLPNADFMKALRTAANVRIGLPATRWMLELGAFFLRTETELILKSRRVVPGRLLDSGFEFQYPHWHDAAAELCRRARAN